MIEILGHETKLTNGTITIPTGCTFIYAVVKGGTTAPTINTVAMDSVGSTPAVGQIPVLAIFKYKPPVNDVVPFLFLGTSVEFIYLTKALDDRSGALSGYSAAGSYSGALTTTPLDLAIGVVAGLNTPIALTGDGVGFTYLIDDLNFKIGYLTPVDASLACLATDTTTASGYWQPQSPIVHGSTLVSAAWVENLPAIHHNGYTYYDLVKHVNIWFPPWDEYPQIYHPAVYSDAWTEYPADIYISTGVSGQVNAVFCSVKKTNSMVRKHRWL